MEDTKILLKNACNKESMINFFDVRNKTIYWGILVFMLIFLIYSYICSQLKSRSKCHENNYQKIILTCAIIFGFIMQVCLIYMIFETCCTFISSDCLHS